MDLKYIILFVQYDRVLYSIISSVLLSFSFSFLMTNFSLILAFISQFWHSFFFPILPFSLNFVFFSMQVVSLKIVIFELGIFSNLNLQERPFFRLIQKIRRRFFFYLNSKCPHICNLHTFHHT